ncbi:alpha/beta fold hydrolase [Azospirillum canadense]|uniref:alpha/beta fold hydrolase n=1 Tax=Azospirillum canadense TaxID=403962 RepID=UPI0022267BFB|nr:alpha/beta hydrolase [Azospirillum canadense]MCW2240204.1 non-heme chloroperoxidase [Azospirillum canadense]
MGKITTKDGAQIFYKDWGSGQPIVFSHGWPLSADAWDGQMMFLGQQGYRVIAHDRRGHGRSDQTWTGNTMDQYADDLAELFEKLDLRNVVMVGHSTGGGEVARYIGRHGTGRVTKAILTSAVPPIMLKTAANPGGLPKEVFDGLRKSTYDNRAQFFMDLSLPFYGFNRDGAKVSEGTRQFFWLQGMMAGVKGAYDCIEQFSETDFTEDLKKMTIPTLFIHGDDDQIVPIGAASRHAVEIAPNATLKVYPGAPHGLPVTHQDQYNADLLAFIKG